MRSLTGCRLRRFVSASAIVTDWMKRRRAVQIGLM